MEIKKSNYTEVDGMCWCVECSENMKNCGCDESMKTCQACEYDLRPAEYDGEYD